MKVELNVSSSAGGRSLELLDDSARSELRFCLLVWSRKTELCDSLWEIKNVKVQVQDEFVLILTKLSFEKFDGLVWFST